MIQGAGWREFTKRSDCPSQWL